MDRQYPTIELQYHNKSKIQKIKFSSTNKNLTLFDLNEESFVYASGTHVYFENQKMNKENYKWEARWHGIQGLALSNDWLAICGQDQIRIYDIAGNILHVLPFSQNLIAMDAYQDHLAIAYHQGPPMWGSSLFGVDIFKVNSTMIKQFKNIQLPITPNSNLKWFGYSQQGVLVSQDTEQTIRMYREYSNQWVTILKLQKENIKLFIQTIHEYFIYGFMIEQRQGMPQQPTVMPRSYPRKMAFQGPYDRQVIDQQDSSDSLLAQYRKQMLKKIIIQHEKYRNQQWFKLKYIRKRQHSLYQITKNIQSTSQLLESIKSFDANIIDMVRRYISGKQFQNQENKPMKARRLEFMYNHLLYEENSKQTLKKILREVLPAQNYSIYFEKSFLAPQNSITKLNSLSNLAFLVADKQLQVQ